MPPILTQNPSNIISYFKEGGRRPALQKHFQGKIQKRVPSSKRPRIFACCHTYEKPRKLLFWQMQETCRQLSCNVSFSMMAPSGIIWQ